jgi:hypothetical protein
MSHGFMFQTIVMFMMCFLIGIQVRDLLWQSVEFYEEGI